MVKKGRATYYKQIFEFVNTILSREDQVRIGNEILQERMKTDINEAFTQARNNYFDAMIAEMNNE